MNVKEKLNLLLRENKLLVIMAIFMFVGASIFLITKRADEHGFCLAKGQVLSDEELYQQAMTDFVQNLLDEVELSRGDRPGMERGEAEGAFWCRSLDCDVWIAPPATYNEIESLRDKFAKVDMYTNKLPIPELLSWQVIHDTDRAGNFKQGANQLTIIATEKGVANYYPIDCCEIYDISDLQRLQQQYAKFRASRGSPPYPKAHKYLLVKKFFAPEINLHYDGRDGPKYFAVQQYAPRIYALNACGHMNMQKETHVKVNEGFY